ncbi:hypothetical protein [Amycolatopsis jiangsuensis]|uniref:Uncharacterized protein n=1 Tax=Amycolatopsis jiangsuensis TaxID=1181879 RepID=A0A840IW43_9PSEU|nr:hypothetical protein [Amycolatopsis jiangsuensis]MBB4686971.1 hypothetical protein [Amycolatopsis jiangsuensis]
MGARPYLEAYWRTSGRDLVDQTIELAAFRWVEDELEYASATGQLQLVA